MATTTAARPTSKKMTPEEEIIFKNNAKERIEFELNDENGNLQFKGIRDGNFKVIRFEKIAKVVPEKEVKPKEVKEKVDKPKAEKVEKPKKEKAPETVTVKQPPLPKDVTRTEDGKLQKLYEVKDIFADDMDETIAEFLCLSDGGAEFRVNLNSEPAKISAMISNKEKYVGFLLVTEFEVFDISGLPKNPIAKGIKRPK